MRRGGYEKEAAVPLGVSLCPETGIIGAMPDLPTSPSRQVATPDGRSLDVWLAGPPDGTPVVYHSGTPGNGLPFAGYVEALTARGLRYVSISRPGYGGSTRQEGRVVADVVPDTQLVLDELWIDRAYVIGWSGGGPHAMACAALLPERVLGTAVLAGVAPWEAPGLDWLANMGAENVDEFALALAGPDALLPFVEQAAASLRTITPDAVADAFGDLVDEVDHDAAKGPFAAYLAALDHEAFRGGPFGWLDDDMAFTRPWGFDVPDIPGRVHVWQGAHDRMVPFAHGQWLAASGGNTCPHLFPQHGHLSLVVEQFPAILDELLAGPS
jgi:pimeloyl-ACP methyl ester carboxylesterase